MNSNKIWLQQLNKSILYGFQKDITIVTIENNILIMYSVDSFGNIYIKNILPGLKIIKDVHTQKECQKYIEVVIQNTINHDLCNFYYIIDNNNVISSIKTNLINNTIELYHPINTMYYVKNNNIYDFSQLFINNIKYYTEDVQEALKNLLYS